MCHPLRRNTSGIGEDDRGYRRSSGRTRSRASRVRSTRSRASRSTRRRGRSIRAPGRSTRRSTGRSTRRSRRRPVQPQQPAYPNQPYSAQPYNIAPNSAAPYSGPPANPYAPPGPLRRPPRPGTRAVRAAGWCRSLVVGAVGWSVLAVAIVFVALSQGSKDGPGPTPAPRPPTSYAGPVDPCLVGTWNQTSYQKLVDMAGTDVDKRETIGKVKMTGAGKRWTIKADGSAVEDDSKIVYSGKDDKGRTINATFSGNTEWSIKTVGRTIEYAGKESTSARSVISVDGRKAGTINLEPNLDPTNYTCVGDVWRTSKDRRPRLVQPLRPGQMTRCRETPRLAVSVEGYRLRA